MSIHWPVDSAGTGCLGEACLHGRVKTSGSTFRAMAPVSLCCHVHWIHTGAQSASLYLSFCSCSAHSCQCCPIFIHDHAFQDADSLLLWQALPALARSIGIYVFASPPPLFLPLGAQLITAVTLLGLSRSSAIHAQYKR